QFVTLIFLLNALCLVILGLVGLGKLIRLVPKVVILGVMNGIAFLIWAVQFALVLAIGEDKQPMLGGSVLNPVIALITYGPIYLHIWRVKKLAIRPQIRSFISFLLWSIILMTILAVAFYINIEKVELGLSVEPL